MAIPTLISFSGGRSSAMMTKRMVDEKGLENCVVTFANTGKENDETLDFVHECDQRWGLNVVWLEYRRKKEGDAYVHIHSKTGEMRLILPDEQGFEVVSYETASRDGEPFGMLLDPKVYLPNIVARYCTGDLKVKIMKKYMQWLGFTRWHVAMGIRYDEPIRWARYVNPPEKEPFDYLMPLYDWEVTKPIVREFWDAQEFDLRLLDYMGNCDLCFLKGKHKKLRIMREHPEKATWWIEQERRVGGTFRKGFSYEEMLHVAKTQYLLFDDEAALAQSDKDIAAEMDYPCHCNGD